MLPKIFVESQKWIEKILLLVPSSKIECSIVTWYKDLGGYLTSCKLSQHPY